MFRFKLYAKVWFHTILQFGLVFFFGWFHNRLLEIFIITGCFFYFRSKFEKQFHASTTWKCTIYTITIFYIISLISPQLSISILLIVLFCYLINLTSYYVRDYLDIKHPKKKKRNTNRQEIINILGETNLNEDYITDYCISKSMPKLAETIYLFLNNTLEETAEILAVDPSTITRRINTFIKRSHT